MCGIAGSLVWHEFNSEQSKDLVSRMTQKLRHRGPDAGQIIALGPIVLGHRRLSIIDMHPGSNQPMCDITSRYWIVYNGEIYNYRELRRTLEQKGHQFITQSDTEVILEAWKCWGVSCLNRFVGMFAFALWDSVAETLFLARDRMGEKPLYYSVFHEYPNVNLVFASELSALRLHPAISSKHNPNAINQFLSLNYILTNTCILEGVEKLAPSHYLLLEKGKAPIIKQYWDLSTVFLQKENKTPQNFETIHQSQNIELQNILQDSVLHQTISDVPLGAFLSGGIDSSSIVAAMTKHQTPELTKTFSIGFHEKSYNELSDSAFVADHLGVSHHTKIVDVDMAHTLPQIVKAFDEPFADSSMIPTYFLAQFSRETVTVCLSGDGGDELFAGYETYAANKYRSIINLLPTKTIRALGWLIDNVMPVSHRKISLDYKLKKFFQGCLFDYQRAHYFWRTVFTESEKTRLLKPECHDIVMKQDPFLEFKRHFESVKDCHPLDQASYVDMKTWLPDDILVKVDRATMAHSLESRAPFLDHRLVEFAAALPVNLKMKGFNKKYILKQSQKSELPHSVLNKRKQGFNAPISPWLTGKLQSLAKDVTLGGGLNGGLGLQEWCQKSAIEELWQQHLSGKMDHGLKLFGLTCLGLWLHS